MTDRNNVDAYRKFQRERMDAAKQHDDEQRQPRLVADVAVASKPRFPTMLRKMWSGGEVQSWIDENWPATPQGGAQTAAPATVPMESLLGLVRTLAKGCDDPALGLKWAEDAIRALYAAQPSAPAGATTDLQTLALLEVLLDADGDYWREYPNASDKTIKRRREAIAAVKAALSRHASSELAATQGGGEREARECWVVARETVVDWPGSRPKLGYTVLADAGTFSSADEASAFITANALPLGWVRMLTTQTPWSALLAGASPEGQARDAAMLDALEQNGWEIGRDDDEDEPITLHRVTGWPNDREWHLVGRGANLRAAIRSAMTSTQPAGGEKHE